MSSPLRRWRGASPRHLLLFAAAQMCVDPQDCLVIEDSRPGVAAAQAAGMEVLLYTGGSHMGGVGFDTDPPVRSFADWAQLPALCPRFFPA